MKSIHNIKKKNPAFTLIEVLVTLMLIGVISAILIPQLYNSMEGNITKTQFIKMYAIMLSGIKLASANFDATPLCYTFTYGGKYTVDALENNPDMKEKAISHEEQCQVFYKELLKSFQIAKTCEVNAFPTCIPEYSGYEKTWREKSRHNSEFIDKIRKSCPNCTETEIQIAITNQIEKYAKIYAIDSHPLTSENIKRLRTAHKLINGQIIIEFGTNGSDVRNFAIDINGNNGPNMWGYDLFPFTIVANPSMPLDLTDGGDDYIQIGGKTSTEMIKEHILRQPNK